MLITIGAVIFLGSVFKTSTALFSKSRKSPNVEFVFKENTSEATAFKLLEIKENVKLDSRSITIYVFDVENRGKTGSRWFDFFGTSKEGAWLPSISLYPESDRTGRILKENKCKGVGTSLDQGEKERICLGYPTNIAQILVPDQQNRVYTYRPVTIDKEASTTEGYTVERKQKGGAILKKDYPVHNGS